MKRILIVLLLAATALSAGAREKVPAADSRITFVGRTLVTQDGSVSFDWSGVYARISFTGGDKRMGAFVFEHCAKITIFRI